MAKHEDHHSEHLNAVSAAGMLVALGIVFGDIGTSPLYVFSAIVGTRTIDPLLALGGFSAIFLDADVSDDFEICDYRAACRQQRRRRDFFALRAD